MTKKITYVFSGGREQRLNIDNQPSEFFYSYHNFKKSGNQMNIIEFKESKNIFSILFKFIDKSFQKLVNIPMYSNSITNIKNFKTLYSSEHIIFVNESTFFSSLFLLIFIRLFKNPRISLFVMGLFSKKISYDSLKFLHSSMVKLLIFLCNDLFFLGKGELSIAIKNYGENDKFIYIPFSVDTNFWKPENKYNYAKNKQILFIGNDGNRNFKLLEDLISSNPDLPFRVITDFDNFRNKNYSNLELSSGNWRQNKISDIELKQIYEISRIVIIPLKESFQPSGQSVALQAMSLGIPVVISLTDGFWDIDKFKNKDNIYFIKENYIEEWNNQIKSIYNNESLLRKLSSGSRQNIIANYSIAQMHEKILERLNH